MLTLDKIYHASYVLKDVIRQTNIVQARGICDDCDVYLKPENLQITGSFKVRGSGYKISQLTEEEKAREDAKKAAQAAEERMKAKEKAKEEKTYLQIRLDATAPIELQRKRLNLLYTIFMNNGVDFSKVDTVFSLTEPNAFIIRTLQLKQNLP